MQSAGVIRFSQGSFVNLIRFHLRKRSILLTLPYRQKSCSTFFLTKRNFFFLVYKLICVYLCGLHNSKMQNRRVQIWCLVPIMGRTQKTFQMKLSKCPECPVYGISSSVFLVYSGMILLKLHPLQIRNFCFETIFAGKCFVGNSERLNIFTNYYSCLQEYQLALKHSIFI